MGLMFLAVTAALAAQIEMRAGDAPPPGDVLAVSIEGVTVGFPPAGPGPAAVGPTIAPVVLSWDRVRALPASQAEAGAPFRALAEKAWRARVRVDRDDLAGAEPLLEELHATYAGLSGPTAAVVGEYLLKCRLARGAQTLAIAPWLTWLGAGIVDSGRTTMRRQKDEIDFVSPSLSPASLDPSTGLIPALPPVWLDGPGVQAFARARPVLAGPTQADAPALRKKAAALATLYWQAARFECGLDAGAIETGADEPGLTLVRQMVMARIGDAPQREQARAQLRARMKLKADPWVEAWCRAGVGRSLLREDSVELRRLGVVELLHVPARLAEQCPYLTGVAIAEAAVALLKLGDRAGADRLRTELQESFAGHPALDWSPIAAWPGPGPTPSTNPSSTTKPASPPQPAEPSPGGT